MAVARVPRLRFSLTRAVVAWDSGSCKGCVSYYFNCLFSSFSSQPCLLLQGSSLVVSYVNFYLWIGKQRYGAMVQPIR